MEKETYEFGIKEHKDLGYKAVVLADDTHIVLGKEVTIMYPKKKFIPIFKEQMKDKKRAYIGVSFSKIELEAIMKGIEMLDRQSKNSSSAKAESLYQEGEGEE